MEVIAVIRDHLQENENVKPNTAFLGELKNKLPEFFNDEGFDIEKFQNALKENDVNEFSEGYQLNFIGKDYARKQAGDAPTSVIVPDNEHNQKEENKNSKNLFFTGDNLEVLRHLRNNYSNKIDVIYIDPPYNTGNDDFVYPDKFEYSDKQLKEFFGMSDEDVLKLDALKGSKSHSAWLTFMYPRLWLAKQLLTDDGVIFISIDDNEQADLKMVMDEIYGENNFITNFIWEKKKKPSFLNANVGTKSEYVTLYSKSNLNKPFSIEKTTMGKKYPFNNAGNRAEKLVFPSGSVSFSDKLNNKIIKSQDMSFGNIKTVLLNDVEVRNNVNVNEMILKGEWRYSQKKLDEFVDKKEKITVASIPFRPNLVKRGGEVKKMHNMLTRKTYGIQTNEDATKEITKIFGSSIFNFTKPSQLIKTLMKSITYDKTDSVILDFFAGSATTADAVMQLNAEDGGNRKFIMVQLPEKTYELDKNGNKKPTKGGKAAFDAGYMSIDEISRERIKRAAKKIKDENPDLNEDFDGGFKHYRVVSPEKETLDKIYDFDPERYELVSDMVDSFSSSALGVPGNASGEDTILTTWLAEDGYDFNTNNLVEYNFAGYKAFGIKDTRLYLIDGNLHPEQTKELLNQLGTNKVKFQSIVVYGYSFNVMDMKELERGLSQLNSKVNLIKRY